MSGVARWFSSRGEIPLLPPPGFRQYAPIIDDSDRPLRDACDHSIGGVAFGLEYCDPRGEMSARTIRCMAMDSERPATLKAFCGLRLQVRTFQVDRIVSVVDLRDGTVLSGQAHLDLLSPYVPGARHPRADAMRNLHRATRDGVLALLQVAMQQGYLTFAAREVVLDYVRAEGLAAGCNVARWNTALWIDNLAPSRPAVAAAVGRLLADRERFAGLMPWLLRLVRSQPAGHVGEDDLLDLIDEVRAHYYHKRAPFEMRAKAG